MEIKQLLEGLRSKENQFKNVLAFIDDNYEYTASAFKNGEQSNGEYENQGSARVLYFAKLNNLSQEDTLLLFGEHYDAVLNTPEGTDHQNIRQFQGNGWDAVSFSKEVLRLK